MAPTSRGAALISAAAAAAAVAVAASLVSPAPAEALIVSPPRYPRPARARAGPRAAPGPPPRGGGAAATSPSSLPAASSPSSPADGLAPSRLDGAAIQIVTLLRVGVPSLAAGIGSALLFPALSRAALAVASGRFRIGAASVASSAVAISAAPSPEATAFVEQFLAVTGLLFSLLLGQTYGFVYSQQEAVYYALFDEVTEAKSLLEQVALACQGRDMYPRILDEISKYVREDLKRVDIDPAVLLSSRPVDDPLEAIMYMTSVGVPGTVYQTVRTLRQARAARLGALQRKVPPVHVALLWVLASVMLLGFPLLGSHRHPPGAGYAVRTVEGCLFGVAAFAVVLTKMVVRELLRPRGGAYNVDRVLGVMVRGLEKELLERRAGRRKK